jgi:hypothetical protein
MPNEPIVAPPADFADEPMLGFLKKAFAAHSNLVKPREVWYRGQANKDWNLLPGLFRSRNALSQEERAYREWMRRAELIDKAENNDWNHLFNMQHFGVPTRLLDWTESFAIAVGFSLVFSNYGESSIPRIFLLDPYALNKKTTGRDRVFEIPDDKTISYRQTYIEGQGIMPIGPVAVRPSNYSLNRRADNQAGVFTIHDNSVQPVNDQPKEIVTSFTIEKDEIPGARLFLRLSHVNAYTIYPDFGGLAGYIRAMLTSENK